MGYLVLSAYLLTGLVVARVQVLRALGRIAERERKLREDLARGYRAEDRARFLRGRGPLVAPEDRLEPVPFAALCGLLWPVWMVEQVWEWALKRAVLDVELPAERAMRERIELLELREIARSEGWETGDSESGKCDSSDNG